MAPAMPHPRVRPPARSHLFPGYGELSAVLTVVQIIRARWEATQQPTFPDVPPIPIADSQAHRDHGLVR